jgi:N-methylhydantoinase A
VFSAFGIGFSDLSQVYEQPLPDADPATIGAAAERLLEAGARDLYAEGVDPADCTVRFRITVERGDTESVIDLDDPQDAAAHLRHSDRASLELAMLAPLPHVTLGHGGDIAASAAGADGTRMLRDGHGGRAEVPVYALLNQQPGAQGSGPAVIEGPFFTMLVPAGWQFATTATGDLRLTDRGQ